MKNKTIKRKYKNPKITLFGKMVKKTLGSGGSKLDADGAYDSNRNN